MPAELDRFNSLVARLGLISQRRSQQFRRRPLTSVFLDQQRLVRSIEVLTDLLQTVGQDERPAAVRLPAPVE